MRSFCKNRFFFGAVTILVVLLASAMSVNCAHYYLSMDVEYEVTVRPEDPVYFTFVIPESAEAPAFQFLTYISNTNRLQLFVNTGSSVSPSNFEWSSPSTTSSQSICIGRVPGEHSAVIYKYDGTGPTTIFVKVESKNGDCAYYNSLATTILFVVVMIIAVAVISCICCVCLVLLVVLSICGCGALNYSANFFNRNHPPAQELPSTKAMSTSV